MPRLHDVDPISVAEMTALANKLAGEVTALQCRIKATRTEIRGLRLLHSISGEVENRLFRTLDGLPPVEPPEGP